MATFQPTQVLPRFLGSSKTSEKKTNGLPYGKMPSKRTELVATSEELIKIHRNTMRKSMKHPRFSRFPISLHFLKVQYELWKCLGRNVLHRINLTNVTCIQVALAHQSATHEFPPCPTSQMLVLPGFKSTNNSPAEPSKHLPSSTLSPSKSA